MQARDATLAVHHGERVATAAAILVAGGRCDPSERRVSRRRDADALQVADSLSEARARSTVHRAVAAAHVRSRWPRAAIGGRRETNEDAQAAPPGNQER